MDPIEPIMYGQPQQVPLSDKLITITSKINIKGFEFKPQQQYCYIAEIELTIGCGCGGKAKQQINHFRVKINNILYDIPERNAVRTVQPIACEDQDFLKARAAIGDTNRVADFDPFRNNNDPYAISRNANINPM